MATGHSGASIKRVAGYTILGTITPTTNRKFKLFDIFFNQWGRGQYGPDWDQINKKNAKNLGQAFFVATVGAGNGSCTKQGRE